jgi:hypothetical protein
MRDYTSENRDRRCIIGGDRPIGGRPINRYCISAAFIFY